MFGTHEETTEIRPFTCASCFSSWLAKVFVYDGFTHYFMDNKVCPNCGKEAICLEDLEKIMQNLESLETSSESVFKFLDKKTSFQISELIKNVKVKKENDKFDGLFVSDWIKVAEQALDKKIQEENNTIHGTINVN